MGRSVIPFVSMDGRPLRVGTDPVSGLMARRIGGAEGGVASVRSVVVDGSGGGFAIADPRRAASSEASRFGFIKSQFHDVSIS